MNTPDNDGWIKLSVGMDFPFPAWLVQCDGRVELARNYWDRRSPTHYKPAVIPAPPKKELAQREEDEAASFEAWKNRELDFALDKPKNMHRDWVDGWHAALAYRDKQNAEDLKLLISDDGYLVGALRRADATHRLRKRCGLDK